MLRAVSKVLPSDKHNSDNLNESTEYADITTVQIECSSIQFV